MTKIQKVIKLLRFIRLYNYYYESDFIIRGDLLYRASYDVDPHNGDIDDYQEIKLAEKDISDYLIQQLEIEMVRITKKAEQDEKDREIVSRFY
jgi:hypothetical protein